MTIKMEAVDSIPFAQLREEVEDLRSRVNALRRELATLPLLQDVSTIGITIGEQRTLRARVRTVVGFEVELSELRTHASLCIQAHGLGGRRHMGAGVFLPVSEPAEPAKPAEP